MPDEPLSHLDSEGRARMVDVSDKKTTKRVAEARALVRMSAEAVTAVRAGGLEKGDALAAARIAGIMAAKRTHELIPLTHPLSLSHVDVEARLTDDGVEIATRVKTTDRTGVEMEALVAASVAALTVYDMCKSVDREITIERVELVSKSGGRRGGWKRE